MEMLLYIYVTSIGLILGSFYNVVGIRLPNNDSLLGRSQCPTCSRTLLPLELFPVFGYILLGGKCKSCKNKISIFYPMMEFITAFLFITSYIYLDNLLEFITFAIFVSLMVIVSVSDLYYKIVPDKILLVFLPLLLVFRILSPIEHWYDGLVGGIIGFCVTYLISIYGKKRFKQEALGGGDIKLYFLVGMFLGYQNVLLSLFFAAFTGLIYVVATKSRENLIPFVPFVFLGSVISYFFGMEIVNWYVGLFY